MPSLASRIRPLFALKGHDTSTAEGRSMERHRRLAWTGLSSLAAKSISVVTVLWSARLTVNYLGAERYGLWMTISSAAALLGFADLGLGSGLVNAVSHSLGRQDKAGMAGAVSSAFFMLLAAAGALSLLLLGAYPWLPWPALFNVRSPLAAAESGPAFLAFALCFAAGLPLSVSGKVYQGHQEGFTFNAWQSLGNMLGLAGVLLAVRAQAGLPMLVLAFCAAPLLAQAAGHWTQFHRVRPWLRPRLGAFSRRGARELFSKGLMFLGFAVMSPLAFYSDNLVVAHLVSAEAVAGYAVTARLFNLGTVLIGMVTGSLWPAYGEAFARNDVAWLRSTLRRTLVWGFWAVALPSLAVALAAPRLLKLWLGIELHPSPGLLAGLVVWSVASSLGFSVGNFLAGCNMLKIDLASTLGMTLAALVLKILLTLRFGVAGVVWGLNIAFCLTFIAHAIFIPRLLSLMEQGRPPKEDTLWLS